MNAKILMPGDLVMAFGQVTEVWMLDASHEDEKDQFINYLDAREFEPIPLTKDILEKIGFSGDVYLWIDVDNEKTLVYYPFEHRLTLEYGDKIEILFKCHCFSVHELQHALKLCGIEKEIALQ